MFLYLQKASFVLKRALQLALPGGGLITFCCHLYSGLQLCCPDGCVMMGSAATVTKHCMVTKITTQSYTYYEFIGDVRHHRDSWPIYYKGTELFFTFFYLPGVPKCYFITCFYKMFSLIEYIRRQGIEYK